MSTGYRKVRFRAFWVRRLGFRCEYVLEKHTGKGLFAFRRERGERVRSAAKGHFAFRREIGQEGQERCERAFYHTVAREDERVWRAARGHIALRCS